MCIAIYSETASEENILNQTTWVSSPSELKHYQHVKLIYLTRNKSSFVQILITIFSLAIPFLLVYLINKDSFEPSTH